MKREVHIPAHHEHLFRNIVNADIEFEAQTINTGSAETFYPYVKQRTQFIYEGGSLLGAKQITNDYTFASGLVSDLDRTVQTANTIATSSHSPSKWGDRATHTLSDVLSTVVTGQSFQHRTSNGEWLIGFTDSLNSQSYEGAIGGGSVSVDRLVTLTPNAGSMAVAGVTRFPGDTELELITSYGYNSDGNRTNTTLSGVNLDSRTATADTFESSRYPTVLTNAKGHVTTVNNYDLRFGLASQVTDANDLVSSANYDEFGRVTSTTDVNGVTTTMTYEACSLVFCDSVNGVAPVIRVSSTSTINPTQTRYLDRLGRVVRTEVEPFSGGFLTVSDVVYDTQGRVEQYTLPYSQGSSSHSVSRQYDLRNRVISEARPNGGSTTIDYLAVGDTVRVTTVETVKLADTVTTDDVQTKVSEYDALGRMVKTTDGSDSTESVDISYDYDAQGNLKTTTVDGGVDGTTITSMNFDAAGNRIELIGPNVGTVTTEYTALGQVRSNTDNKGQATVYAYDVLGRITSRADTDDTAYWNYDPVGALGSLGSRSNGNGSFSETYHYNDPFRGARLSSITTDIAVPGDSRQYTRSINYDSDGRVDTQTFPSGLAVQSQYNSRGYLSDLVKNSGSSQTLQTFNQIDQFGVTQETYGNGVTTQRQFDPQSGRLQIIDTEHGSTVIQGLSYNWRSNGTLQSRLSVTANGFQEDQFEYDVLNRLTKAQTLVNGSPQRDLDYEYNKLGNMLAKTSTNTSDTQVTDNDYGEGINTSSNAGPHAVTSATIDGVVHTLTYDANGSIIEYDAASGPDKFIEYNHANQPVKIVVGTSINDTNPVGKDEFMYGPDGQRYYKKSTYLDSNDNQRVEHTFYVGAFEEIVPDTSSGMDSILKTRVGSAVLHITEIPIIGSATESIEYLHRDHLGSVDTITDESGDVLQTMAFEPYGARRSNDWLSNLSGSEEQSLLDGLATRTSRGFTGHEHLDRTGFIHMNGRVYDPGLGRFLSPDPYVQSPTNSQSYNRYSYVWNTSLSAVDPSGFEIEEIIVRAKQRGVSGDEVYIAIWQWFIDKYGGGSTSSGGSRSGGNSGSSGNGSQSAEVDDGLDPGECNDTECRANLRDEAQKEPSSFQNMRRGAEVLFEDFFRVRWHYRALNGDFGIEEKEHAILADKALTTAAGMYYLDKEVKLNGQMVNFRSEVNDAVYNSISNNKAYFAGRQLAQGAMVGLVMRYAPGGLFNKVTLWGGLTGSATTVSGFGRGLNLFDQGVRDPVSLMSGAISGK
jgi:RHS repeat-associated protein